MKIRNFLDGDVQMLIPNQITSPDGSPIGMQQDDFFECGSEL